MNNTAVIDGDSICYIASKDNLEISLGNVDSIMETIKVKTDSDKYYLFLSTGPYFRHLINTNYKANRAPTKLLFVKEIKEYLVNKYGAIERRRVEADDLSAFAMYNGNNSFINCAIDKDVINQVVGKYFNYRTHESGITNPKQALEFLYTQVLIGDAVDNIKGIPFIGKKKASRILEDCNNAEELQNATLKAYQNFYGGIGNTIFHFQNNFRQVYLLRRESDFINETGSSIDIGEPINF